MRVELELENVDEIVLQELLQQHDVLYDQSDKTYDEFIAMFALKEVIRWNTTPTQWDVFAEAYEYTS